jgi:hypothetical protein
MEMASEYDLAEWLWVEDRDADVILVNSDLAECTTKFKLDKPAQNKIRPILIYCCSSEEKCKSYTHSLRKPASYTTIIHLLQSLENKLSNSVANSSAHPIHNNNSKQDANPGLTSKKKKSNGSSPDSTSSDLTLAHLDSHEHSDLELHIDDDSDYDIYDLLMDSEFDAKESDTSIRPDAKPQHAANDQTATEKKAQRVESKSKSDLPVKRHLEKQRFIGLIKKHVLSKFSRTG